MAESQNEPQKFKITLPIVKTSVRIIKDEDGNDKEVRYVEGVASTTDLDLHGDRMAPEAIKSMADSLKQHVINLNAEHDTSWQSELGGLEELNITDDYDLTIKAELNEMSKSHDLWYALTELNKKLGLSVGGYVKEYEMVKEGEGEDATWVRIFKDIELDHIAVTSRPANPKTWVDVIAKSLEEDELLKKIEVETERNLPMANKKKLASLEAEEAKKKADAAVKSEDEQDENLATPETEETEDTSKDKEKEPKAKKPKDSETENEEEESDESEGEEDTEEEGGKPEDTEEDESEEGEESDEEESEEDESEEEEESDEEESDEGSEDEEEKSTDKSDITEGLDAEKLLKTVKQLNDGIKEVITSNVELQKRIETLEEQPADRKTVEVKKTLGDSDTDDRDIEELREELDKKVAKVKEKHASDPNLFSRIQRLRVDYAKAVAGIE